MNIAARIWISIAAALFVALMGTTLIATVCGGLQGDCVLNDQILQVIARAL